MTEEGEASGKPRRAPFPREARKRPILNQMTAPPDAPNRLRTARARFAEPLREKTGHGGLGDVVNLALEVLLLLSEREGSAAGSETDPEALRRTARERPGRGPLLADVGRLLPSTGRPRPPVREPAHVDEPPIDETSGAPRDIGFDADS